MTFDNGPRKVELEGEAYFEVCKTGQPFIVWHSRHASRSVGNHIQHLCLSTGRVSDNFGKRFCQSKYRNWRKLYFKAFPASYHQPRKQQHTDTHGRCRIYTSWIKGKIHFKDQRLEDIMKILSRWYDMEVIFANEKIKRPTLRMQCRSVFGNHSICTFVGRDSKSTRKKSITKQSHSITNKNDVLWTKKHNYTNHGKSSKRFCGLRSYFSVSLPQVLCRLPTKCLHKPLSQPHSRMPR